MSNFICDPTLPAIVITDLYGQNATATPAGCFLPGGVNFPNDPTYGVEVWAFGHAPAQLVYAEAVYTLEITTDAVTYEAAYGVWVAAGSPTSGTAYDTFEAAAETYFATASYQTYLAAFEVYEAAYALYVANYTAYEIAFAAALATYQFQIAHPYIVGGQPSALPF